MRKIRSLACKRVPQSVAHDPFPISLVYHYDDFTGLAADVREKGLPGLSFVAGTEDYTVEFEPSATALETEGVGYVVASLGEASGYVPYTAFSAKNSFMEQNPEIIQSFTNALQKGMDYVNSHTPEEIALAIQPQFAETELSQITTIVKRYYDQDTWKENLIFEQDAFDLLQNILMEAGELEKFVPYEQLVVKHYAEAALQ